METKKCPDLLNKVIRDKSIRKDGSTYRRLSDLDAALDQPYGEMQNVDNTGPVTVTTARCYDCKRRIRIMGRGLYACYCSDKFWKPADIGGFETI